MFPLQNCFFAVWLAPSAALYEEHVSSVSLIQSRVQRQSAAKHYWPSARGRSDSVGFSPYAVPSDLSVTSWNWTQNFTIVNGALIDRDSNIYAMIREGIHSWTKDGQHRWFYRVHEAPDEYIANNAVITGDVLIGIVTSGRAFAIRLADAKEVWSRKVAPHGGYDLGFMSEENGRVVLEVNSKTDGSSDTVLAISATNGSDLWSFHPDEIVWNLYGLFTNDGNVVFQDRTGKAYCVKASDGKLLWKKGGKPSSWTDGSAMLDRPNGILYAISGSLDSVQNGSVSAFNVTDGSLLWDRDLPLPPNTMPAAGTFAANQDPVFIAALGRQGGIVPGPLNLGGKDHYFPLELDASDKPSGFQVLDAKSGGIQYEWKGPTWKHTYVAGETELLESRMLSQKKSPFCAPNTWSAPTFSADGTIYTGFQDGNIYVLRPKQGSTALEQVSSHRIGHAFTGAGFAFAPGIVAVPACNGLYVFRSE